MNNEINCRPYIIYVGLFVIFAISSAVVVSLSIFAFPEERIVESIKIGILGFVFGLMAIYSYNLSKITFLFGNDGITIRNIKGKKEQYFSYQDYPYGTFCKSYRGHMYLVFSADKLQKGKLKKIVNRSAWTNSVFVENTIVFLINNISEKKQELIKGIVSDKVSLKKM